MAWSSPDSWLTRLFSGDPLIIAIALFITFSFPLALHFYFYTQAARSKLTPTFLLLGPSGAGKTSLVSLIQKQSSNPDHAEPAPTRTSQVKTSVSLLLPPSIPLGSNKYRSENDASLKDRQPIPYVLLDTPGHGKLRTEHALSQLNNPALRGVIFVADSTVLDSSDSSASRDTAAYLHDTLLALQRRATGKGPIKAKPAVPVLVAANKQDLFTALPAGAVRERLQTEIERVRISRSKGLTAVGQESDEDAGEDVLGGGGEDKFSFKLLEDEYDTKIDVIGGAVKGEEAGKGVRRWQEWIGGCL